MVQISFEKVSEKDIIRYYVGNQNVNYKFYSDFINNQIDNYNNLVKNLGETGCFLEDDNGNCFVVINDCRWTYGKIQKTC